MLKPVYIQASRALTPQDTFLTNEVPAEVRTSADNILYYHEPDYLQYLGIMQLRRMSRLTKAGIVTAIQCLADAGVASPDAIITGTGKGSLSDTEKFLKMIPEFNETALNPTPFIQSTYNSLNGLIALHHNSHGYNNTYVHRGFSFENAITDAMLLLHEGAVNNVLAGAFEEITAEHFVPKQKLGYWKTEKIESNTLLQSQTSGSIAGEGVFFFVLTADPGQAQAQLSGLQMLHEPSVEDLPQLLHQFLAQYGLTTADIDVFISGRNGDSRMTPYDEAMTATLPADTSILAYKHLTGEFDTSSGFGVWSASRILHTQQLPAAMLQRQGKAQPIRQVLVHHHYYSHQAFYLLQQVP
jgi:3-oxoacyl-(acyl-carrier-protein) synthase